MSVWGPSLRVKAAGKDLHVVCQGPAPGGDPTLVLLHEGLGAVELWRDFPAALVKATGLGLCAYSRAGYGQSDLADLPRPLDYMTREAEEVLPVILDRMGIARAILVGHSDGATISAIYAGSVADPRVRGLVLMAPHFFTEPIGLAEIARAKTAYAQGDLRARMAKYHRDPDHTFLGWNEAWLDPKFHDWNVADVIDHIRVPVLAIQGREDQYGTLAQLDELETRCYAPVETLILERCRHAPFLEHPEEVVAAIAAFCARLIRIEAAGRAAS